VTDPPPKRAAWFRNTDASSLGIEIVVAVTLGAVGGFYVERYVTHWSPWTMLIGLAAGIGAAIKAIVRTIRTYRRQLAAEANERSSHEHDAEPGGPTQSSSDRSTKVGAP
jgi:F0F1-type ATP synthase assembly protein I